MISIGLFARRGAFAGVATFLITFISSLAAFNYYPLIQSLLVRIHSDTALYADAVALLLCYFLVFVILQYLALEFLEENIQLNALVNSIAGAAFGGMAAILFSGVLVIAWFMLPGSVYYRSDEVAEPNVWANADEQVLSVVRFMANERIPGQSPFDPAQEFMRTRTNKFVPRPPDSAYDPRLPGRP